MMSKGVAPEHSLARPLLLSMARVAIGVTGIFLLLSLVPEERNAQLAIPLIGFLTMGIGYAAFLKRQLTRVKKSKYPGLTAAEALIFSAAMFLAIFAATYVLVAGENPQAFTEPLDHFSAVYFALTVLATVGFGDITPVSTVARLVTMVQMALGLAFVAVLVRLVSGAAQAATQRKRQEPSD